MIGFSYLYCSLVRTIFFLIWNVLLNKIKVKQIFRLTAPLRDETCLLKL